MFGFIGRRVLQGMVVLWAVITILFLVFRLMPGDPLVVYISDGLSEEHRLQMMRQFGLDRPLWEQYFIYLANILQGDLGVSFHYRRPVVELIFSVLPNTLILTVTGVLLAYLFGILMGAYLAWKRGSVVETVGISAALTTRAAPEFWLGMLLLAAFAFSLGWFPSGGANSAGVVYESEWARVLSLDFLAHLALPSLAMALHLQGLPLLLMRSNMLEVMKEEYVVMARMKGLSEWRIILHHAARNALLPVVTAFTIVLASTIGSNVVIETVFSWPGLGRMLVEAVQSSDYPLAQGAFLLIAVTLSVFTLIADLLYGMLDPRVSYDNRR